MELRTAHCTGHPGARYVCYMGPSARSPFGCTTGSFRDRNCRPQFRRLKAEDSPDFVERVFGAVFGKKALEETEPFGMKRLTSEECPELYPATTTETADPVDGDSEEVSCFRGLLAKTQLEKTKLRLAYDANVHGWNPASFHQQVDTFGASIVLAETEGGAVLGGYNPSGWIGLGESRDSIAAFLFTWPDGDIKNPAIKLPKVGGAGLAVIDKQDYGIQFGAEGLTIALTAWEEKRAKSRLGSYYSKLPDGGRSLFSDKDDAKYTLLTKLQVFVGEGQGEEWKLEGITWKTKMVE